MQEPAGGLALAAIGAWIWRLRGRQQPRWLSIEKALIAGQASENRETCTVQIAYCTDVEGNWKYFCHWVRLSPGVTFDDGSDRAYRRMEQVAEYANLRLEDGWHFVFGGDAGDKGPHTLCMIRTLNLFKRKYPDRVHVLLGNRDLNKIRITSEIELGELDRIQSLGGPPWVNPAAKRVSPKMYLQKIIAKSRSISPGEVTDEMLSKENTLANRLKWMLLDTMGSAGDFERRRQELARCSGVTPETVSDDDIVGELASTGGVRGVCARLETAACAPLADAQAPPRARRWLMRKRRRMHAGAG